MPASRQNQASIPQDFPPEIITEVVQAPMIHQPKSPVGKIIGGAIGVVTIVVLGVIGYGTISHLNRTDLPIEAQHPKTEPQKELLEERKLLVEKLSRTDYNAGYLGVGVEPGWRQQAVQNIANEKRVIIHQQTKDSEHPAYRYDQSVAWAMAENGVLERLRKAILEDRTFVLIEKTDTGEEFRHAVSLNEAIGYYMLLLEAFDAGQSVHPITFDTTEIASALEIQIKKVRLKRGAYLEAAGRDDDYLALKNLESFKRGWEKQRRNDVD